MWVNALAVITVAALSAWISVTIGFAMGKKEAERNGVNHDKVD